MWVLIAAPNLEGELFLTRIVRTTTNVTNAGPQRAEMKNFFSRAARAAGMSITSSGSERKNRRLVAGRHSCYVPLQFIRVHSCSKMFPPDSAQLLNHQQQLPRKRAILQSASQ